MTKKWDKKHHVSGKSTDFKRFTNTNLKRKKEQLIEIVSIEICTLFLHFRNISNKFLMNIIFFLNLLSKYLSNNKTSKKKRNLRPRTALYLEIYSD